MDILQIQKKHVHLDQEGVNGIACVFIAMRYDNIMLLNVQTGEERSCKDQENNNVTTLNIYYLL